MCTTQNGMVGSLLGLGCPDCGGGCSSLGSYGKAIEWNTEPVINTYIWNRDGYWDCNDWMTWHQKVAAKYGVKRANEVFMIWWNKQSWYAYAQDCMLLNRSFRDYFNGVGLKLDEIAKYITKPVDFVVDAGGNVLDAGGKVIENTAEAAADATDSAGDLIKLIGKLVPIAITGVAIGLAYYGYKHYIKGNEKITVPKATVGKIEKAKKIIHV